MLNVKRTILSFYSLLVIVGIFLFYLIFLEFNNQLQVYFLDVGQGDSVLIKTSNNIKIVIDGGPDNTLVYKLGEYLPFYDRHIDLMVLTHPDSDHLVGLVEVLKRYKVKYVLMSGIDDDLPAYTEFLQKIKQQDIRVLLTSDVRVITLGSSLLLDVLSPDSMTKFSTNNQASLVLRLTNGNDSILFMGDAPSRIERKLLDNNLIKETAILKIGHHGSNTSSNLDFLKAVNPRLAIISVGENRYGHPHRSVLKRLLDLSITTATTWDQGDIKMALP